MPILQDSALMWGALVQQPPLALFSILVIAWLAQVDGICDWLINAVCPETHFLKILHLFGAVLFHLMSCCLSEMSCIVSLCMSEKNVEKWTPFYFHDSLWCCHLHCEIESLLEQKSLFVKFNLCCMNEKNTLVFFSFFLKSFFLAFVCFKSHIFSPSHPTTGTFGGFGTTTTSATGTGSTFSFGPSNNTTGQRWHAITFNDLQCPMHYHFGWWAFKNITNRNTMQKVCCGQGSWFRILMWLKTDQMTKF